MIDYVVLHHIPGRIRIYIPAMKWFKREDLHLLSHITLPPAIKNIRVNPLNHNLIINYDPKQIDIIKYLNEMASSKDLLDMVDMRVREKHAR